MSSRASLTAMQRRSRARLADERGFTMLVTLGVLVVVSLLVAAAFSATQSDTHLTQHDLDAKRAFYAARAGINRYLFLLNQSPDDFWLHCPAQSKTAVQGSSTQQYSYKPLAANNKPACADGDLSSIVDTGTGTFRAQVTGYAGNPEVTRTLVASFRRDTPLDFLWYTDYETLDPYTYPDPSYADQNCRKWHRQGRTVSYPGGSGTTPYCDDIQWVTGDVVNGPMYTEDQLDVCGSPTFGRPGTSDKIESMAPTVDYRDPDCSYSPTYNGQKVTNAPQIDPPDQNDLTTLLSYASTFGKVYSGTTTVALNGSTATITRCTSNSSSSCTRDTNLSLTQYPIISVTGSGCSSYSPYGPTYPAITTGGTYANSFYGTCGNVYVSGTYTVPLTIVAQNDIIISGDITTTHDSSGQPSGNALLGLVGMNFIRLMHGMTSRATFGDSGNTYGHCGNATNVSSQTLQNPVIDAAILALQHSFIVDNFDCGGRLGNLTVNGAIAQLFRGTVGRGGGTSGYLKDYSYDDRLAVQEPPYVFNLANASWHIGRETLCTLGGSGSGAC